MKISVITWDGNFRESLHTIDFFASQSLDPSEYEVLWVDFYGSNRRVLERASHYSNVRLIPLGHRESEPWHLGVCINAGLKEAAGEVLVIPDGDVAVERDFLMRVIQNHERDCDAAVYHRRFDEPRASSNRTRSYDLDYLKAHAVLINPSNYAGCLTVRRESLLAVNGFESHAAFAGAGISGMETYVRLRNAGMCVRWDPRVNVYHPWHPSSGSAGHTDVESLRFARVRHPWIFPYAGLAQSWIVRERQLRGDTLADPSRCDELLRRMPRVESEVASRSGVGKRAVRRFMRMLGGP